MNRKQALYVEFDINNFPDYNKFVAYCDSFGAEWYAERKETTGAWLPNHDELIFDFIDSIRIIHGLRPVYVELANDGRPADHTSLDNKNILVKMTKDADKKTLKQGLLYCGTKLSELLRDKYIEENPNEI